MKLQGLKFFCGKAFSLGVLFIFVSEQHKELFSLPQSYRIYCHEVVYNPLLSLNFSRIYNDITFSILLLVILCFVSKQSSTNSGSSANNLTS